MDTTELPTKYKISRHELSKRPNMKRLLVTNDVEISWDNYNLRVFRNDRWVLTLDAEETRKLFSALMSLWKGNE